MDNKVKNILPKLKITLAKNPGKGSLKDSSKRWAVKLVKDEAEKDELETILPKLKMTFVRNLGKGSFGSVVEVKKTDSSKRWALKLVKDKVEKDEIVLWSHLRHRNVLQMEAAFRVEGESPVHGFFMPLAPRTLMDAIENLPSVSRDDPLRLGKKWLRDVLQGLSYMHQNGVAHVDLKTNNVLLAADSTALICDFTFATHAEAPTRRWGLPLQYRPPEAHRYGRADDPLVDPKAFDLWSAGIVALELLTGNGLLKSSRSVRPKTFEGVEALISGLLAEPDFEATVRSEFSASRPGRRDLACARDFVQMLLQLDPESRGTAAGALDHRFLGGSKLCGRGIHSRLGSSLAARMTLHHQELASRAVPPRDPRLAKFSGMASWMTIDAEGRVAERTRGSEEGAEDIFADVEDSAEPPRAPAPNEGRSNASGYIRQRRGVKRKADEFLESQLKKKPITVHQRSNLHAHQSKPVVGSKPHRKQHAISNRGVKRKAAEFLESQPKKKPNLLV